MLTWLLFFIIVLSAVMLNIIATQTVLSSHIHANTKTRKYIMLIWCIPVLGVIAVMILINQDIKKNKETFENDVANVMKDLTERINGIEAGIRQKRNKRSLH